MENIKLEIINKFKETFEFLLYSGYFVENSKTEVGYHFYDIEKGKKITGYAGFKRMFNKLNSTASIEKDVLLLLKNEDHAEWVEHFPANMKQFIIDYFVNIKYIVKN